MTIITWHIFFFWSLCEFVILGDCFGPRYFRDLKKDDTQLLLSRSYDSVYMLMFVCLLFIFS